MTGCGKVFYNLYRLKIHLRAHEGTKPFKCQVCGRNFNERGNLKTHILIHTREKPYLCTVTNCSSRFRTYGHLKDHMSTHFNLRFFDCKECGLAFARKWTLRKHMFTHTGERPYSCSICPKKFSDKSNMTTHLKKHKFTGMNEDICAARFSMLEEGRRENIKKVEKDYTTRQESSKNITTADLQKVDDENFIIRPSFFKPHIEEKINYQNLTNCKQISNESFNSADDLLNFTIIEFEKENMELDRVIYELFVESSKGLLD